MLTPALHDAANHAAIVGRANLHDVAVISPPAIYEKPVGCNGRDRHLWHDFLGPQEPTGTIIGLLDDGDAAFGFVKIFTTKDTKVHEGNHP